MKQPGPLIPSGPFLFASCSPRTRLQSSPILPMIYLETLMKTCWILTLLCCSLPALALGGEMEKATVHSMRKVPCMDAAPQAARLGVLSNLVGGPSDIGGECVEYELRTEKVSYVIRPHRPILLLLGGNVSIKFASSELLLRTAGAPKDIRCAVLAMSLRAAAEKAEQRSAHNYQSPVRCFEAGREIRCPD